MNILLIEDDYAVVHLIERFFGEIQFQSCHSLKETWKFLAETKIKFDFIFLDLKLSIDEPAEYTLSQIPNLKKTCPLIMAISGFPQYKDEALKQGATAFILKDGAMTKERGFFFKLAELIQSFKQPTPIEKNLEKLKDSLNG